MVTASLGFVKASVLPAPIPAAVPPALDSAQHATAYAEARDYCALESIGDFVLLRTPAQTDTPLLHTICPRFQHFEAIRDQITGRLDIVDAADTPCRVRRQHGRRRDLLLAQQVRPQVLATGHRDRPRRHR
jgi:hypothetical protein